MEIPKEFTELCRGFHQGMEYSVSSLDEMIIHVLWQLEETDLPGAQVFLSQLLSGQLSDGELQQLWRSTPADIYFPDTLELKKILGLLLEGMNTHPKFRKR
jgi:hypothetical protein